ncbi:MAG TPA: HIT family protein [Bryobacteraceae bacterium]|nr:HIT family protein [Bryobacteraceae bacterium]
MSSQPTSKPCQFCAIVAGSEPAYVVFEDELTLGFLDARPLFPGHVLLVPRVHYETIDQLPGALLGPLFGAMQLISQAVESAMHAEGAFVAINNRVSQSVPHLHIHIVPRRKKDGLKGFFWPRNPYKSESEMEDVLRAIRAAIAKST